MAFGLQHNETVQELWYQRTQLQLLGVNTTLKRQGLNGKYQVTAGAGIVPPALRSPKFLRKYHAALQQATDQARPLKQCAVCGMVEKLKRCGRCGFVYYCGEAHQRAHLTLHRELCVAIAAKSLVACAMCQTRVNVWFPDTVWGSAASAAKIEFACVACRQGPSATCDVSARFPRAVWALCGNFFTSRRLAGQAGRTHERNANGHAGSFVTRNRLFCFAVCWAMQMFFFLRTRHTCV